MTGRAVSESMVVSFDGDTCIPYARFMLQFYTV